MLDLPSFGDGSAELGPRDIDRALTLYSALLGLVLAAATLAALLAWWLG